MIKTPDWSNMILNDYDIKFPLCSINLNREERVKISISPMPDCIYWSYAQIIFPQDFASQGGSGGVRGGPGGSGGVRGGFNDDATIATQSKRTPPNTALIFEFD
jgi:hypothetical protein